MPRLTTKGQVTIPVAIRYALGLEPGDNLVFALEGERGVFRRGIALDDLRGRFDAPARPGSHPLERLLVEGDEAFARNVDAERGRGRRLRVPDAVILDVAGRLQQHGAAVDAIAAALRDVLADRAVRADHPAALRAALDALAAGDDALHAYALARG
jgi:AbrB family looped-hinge helix DNA binding protein